MKKIDRMGAQGDVMFIRAEIPDGATAREQRGPIVVAHSETGHHHAIADGLDGPVAHLFASDDPLTCYLRVTAEYADVVHHRPFDTHETVRLGRGDWMVRRQREYTPQGLRMVED